MRTIPIPTLTEKDRARFLAKLAPADGNGCRLWTASTYENGYGQFGIGRRNVSAHRVAYTLFVGPIPDGLELDHFTCFNHACCTPEHLRPATRKQNGENQRGAHSDSTSGVRGVSKFVSKGGRVWWRARVIHNYREHSFGYFDTIEEAESAAVAGRLSLFTNNTLDRVTP